MKPFAVLISLALIFVIAAGALGASSAFAAPGNKKTRVMVEFALGKKAAVENALRAAGAEFHYSFDDLHTFAVTLPTAALDGISRNPNVVAVEEDPLRYPISIMPAADDVPSPGGEPEMVPYGIDMVQARDVWDTDRDGTVDSSASTGAGKKICIIDSGLFTEHEDLNGVSVDGYDDVNLPWNEDGCGHGTHVAGTMATYYNSLGVVGVAPEVDLYIVRVFGDNCGWAYSSDLVNAANRCSDADVDANIISMSLGGIFKSRTEQKAFDALYGKGILSVAAAGNDGNTRKSYPASYDSVVSVAAIDSDKNWADFSQYNSQVELAAPGVNVLSTVPGVDRLTVDDVRYSANLIENSATTSATGELANGGLCTDINNDWYGKVVLCERGDISFYDKVTNVSEGGGVAAVIYNNETGNFLGTLGKGNSSTIIAISLSKEDGDYLLGNKIGRPATVTHDPAHPYSGYEKRNGTSMATPHVSAVAALVWSAHPSLPNVDIRDALDATAIDLGVAGRDDYYGYGLVQAADAIASLGGDTPPTNEPPVASFSFTTSGLTANFTDTSTDPDGTETINSWSWFFGDGSTSSEQSPQHTYDHDGLYTVTLTVTDIGDATSSKSIDVTVQNSVDEIITLNAIGERVNPVTYKIELDWGGATSGNVDIYCNDALLVTTVNDGYYTYSAKRLSGDYIYKVCNPISGVCSDIDTVTF